MAYPPRSDRHPQLVAESIFRFGLYADEILVVDPFPNPWIIRDKYNPILHPELYLETTLQLVSFVFVLAPWIEAQIVRIVPSPPDLTLLSALWRAAEARLKERHPSDEDLQDEALLMADFQKRMLLKMPRDYHKRIIEEAGIDLGLVSTEELLDHLEAERKRHPLMLEGTIDRIGGQRSLMNFGGNLETTTMIAQLTGAFPYTNVQMKWRELLSVQGTLPASAQVWTPLTKAFQALRFKFLNHVDSDLAVRMREEGRLEGLRSLLRRIWGTAVEGPDGGTVEATVRGFCDELTQEYHKAEADWQAIDRDVLKWAGCAATGFIAASAGSMSPAFPALTALLGLTTGLIDSRFKRRAFRKNVPMSVFIDLDRATPRA